MLPVENCFETPSCLSLVAWLARASQYAFGFICLVALASPQLQAQQGLPIVQQTGIAGSNGPSPMLVDAKQFLGGASGDACGAINAAILQMETVKNGVVDARGITGDVPCAFNMFGTGNPTGKLLLGNVVIHARVTQVQPPLFQVEGTGWAIDDNVSNNDNPLA
jgi:hypothetical protein